MRYEEHRLATFKTWPLPKKCAANARSVRRPRCGVPRRPRAWCRCRDVRAQMAKAGFVHRPTAESPDLVECFVCHKQLDGWDPTDDPMYA